MVRPVMVLKKLKKVGKKIREVGETAGKVGLAAGKEVGKAVVAHALERGKQAAVEHLKGKVNSYVDHQVRGHSVDKKHRASL